MMSQAGMQAGPLQDVGVDHNIVVEEVEQERNWENMLALGKADKWDWASLLRILPQERDSRSSNSIAQLLQPMNRYKDTIVHRAASDGNTEVVRKLLLLIKKDNQELWRERQANIFGNNPLHLAALFRNEETCKCLAEMDPETVKAKNKDGNTPLHLAASWVHKDTCKWLAEMAPETAKATNKDGNTPLHLAALFRNEEICKCLAEMAPETAKATNINGNTPLHLAADWGLKDACKFLANMAPETAKATNKDGNTPLHLAALFRTEETCKCLAEMAPETAKATNKDGNTPLHLAASRNRKETCKCLAEMAPETCQARNRDGNTPLHLAAFFGHEDTCKCLVDMAPETAKATNADGDAPIFIVAALRFHSLTKFLDVPEIALGTRSDGDTILHFAISGEDFDLANAIIDKYEELIYYRNDRGHTPLHLLANNPSLFRSGCRLGLLDHFFYKRIEVSTESKSDDLKHQKQEKCTFKLPGKSRYRQGALCYNEQTSEHPVSIWLFILAKFGFSERIIEVSETKHKHERVKKVMKQLLEKIDKWDFYDIYRGLGLKSSLEWKKGINPGKTMQEIASEPHTNFMQESQLTHLTGSQPHQDPPTHSNVHSSTIGTSPNMLNHAGSVSGPFPGLLGMIPNVVNGASGGVILPGMGASLGEVCWEYLNGCCAKTDCKFNHPHHNLLMTLTALAVMAATQALEAQAKSSGDSSAAVAPAQAIVAAQALEAQAKSVGDSSGIIESPFLIAGKNGVIEMVQEILKKFPSAIRDMDSKRKNIMLLAAEHRQPEIYAHMLEIERKSMSLLGKVDAEGNSVLHLAAKHPQEQPLLIPGAALQMQSEFKWFKFVKENMPLHLSKLPNQNGQTAMEVFINTHQELAMKRAKWLGNASKSCSVVATLITAAAFATIASVPGGLLQDHGAPVLQGRLFFNIFSVSSLLALCFSAISLIMFLGILISPHQDLDFGNATPNKLIGGFASLFISIVAIFLSFFSGDLFVLENKMRYLVYPTFILTSCVALVAFPRYFEFIRETFARVPKRTYPQNLSF